MPFTPEEIKELTAIKGIGNTFVTRLEEMGFDTVEKLANTSVESILQRGTELTGSTCYKNSPQARKAAEEAIYWAEKNVRNKTLLRLILYVCKHQNISIKNENSYHQLY